MIITIVRKPLEGSVCENIQETQCGGLHIDPCRISNVGDPTDKRGTTRSRKQVGFWSDDINEGSTGNGFNGRWPANFILNPKFAGLLPAQAGGRWGKGSTTQPKTMYFGTHKDHNVERFKRDCEKFMGDVGPAARFFLQVKE